MELSDTLVVGRVVGDVVDPFIRSTTMKVLYRPNRTLVNGSGLKPSEITSQPRVLAGGELRALFTLVRTSLPFFSCNFFTLSCLLITQILHLKVMVDPDSPSPSNPTNREYLHWYVLQRAVQNDQFSRIQLIFFCLLYMFQVGGRHPWVNWRVLR